jgi:tRNA (guanosine-2'-O-)-methyltransferase
LLLKISKHQSVEGSRLRRIQEVLHKRQKDITVLLENVFDPHNISAVMRTCDSVGIGTIHTLYTEAPPHNHIGFRSSAGTWKWIDQIEHANTDDCISNLRKNYGRVYAAHLDESATSVYDFDLTEPVAIVFGNEQKGCSASLIQQCDGTLYIPQVGMVKSLNISVACAIVMYEAFRQKWAAGHYNNPSLPPDELERLLGEWTDFSNIREKKNRKA